MSMCMERCWFCIQSDAFVEKEKPREPKVRGASLLKCY